MSGRVRFYIIVNPFAGASKREKTGTHARPDSGLDISLRGLLGEVVDGLRTAHAEVTLVNTHYAGHGCQLAEEAAYSGQFDVIVAAGGDGTINEVARGLVGASTPMGIIPLGTANVLAIELGLRVRAREICDMLLWGDARLIGTGLVNGDVFLLMAGAGFDGAVVDAIHPTLKRVSGQGAFVWASFCEWLKGPGRPLQVTIDGRVEKAAWVLITNVRHYAGPFVLAPSASLFQPGLQIFLFRKPGRWAFIRYFIALGLGRLNRLSSVDVFVGSAIEITSTQSVSVEVDGDARGDLPLTLEKGRQFLRMVMPRVQD
ncbi:MAG: NAD(+)/NADH kinase [Parvibaculaceae bacterium]|nr:NAD(+)/NADH kinase [Parvibaculaceae bacterium]